MDPDRVRDEIAGIAWYHSIDLGHGIVTPGLDDTRHRLPAVGLPNDLTGVTVLDIGAWDGFFSFEAERRGASRVLAVDSFSWRGDGWAARTASNARAVFWTRGSRTRKSRCWISRRRPSAPST